MKLHSLLLIVSWWVLFSAHETEVTVEQLKKELVDLHTSSKSTIDELQLQIKNQQELLEAAKAESSKSSTLLLNKLAAAEKIIMDLSAQNERLKSTGSNTTTPTVEHPFDTIRTLFQVWIDNLPSFSWYESLQSTATHYYTVFRENQHIPHYISRINVYFDTHVTPIVGKTILFSLHYMMLLVRNVLSLSGRQLGLFQQRLAAALAHFAPFYHTHLHAHVQQVLALYNTYLAIHMEPVLDLVWRKCNYLAYHFVALVYNDDAPMKLYIDSSALLQRVLDYIAFLSNQVATTSMVQSTCGVHAAEAASLLVYSLVAFIAVFFSSPIIYFSTLVLSILLLPLRILLRILFSILCLFLPLRATRPPPSPAATLNNKPVRKDSMRGSMKKLDDQQNNVTTLRSTIETLPGPHSLIDDKGELVDKAAKGGATAVLCLSNMVDLEELRDDALFNELFDDVNHECGLYGIVREVRIPRPHPRLTYKEDSNVKNGIGKVFVHFFEIKAAIRARAALDGRKYDSKTLQVAYFPEDLFVMKVNRTKMLVFALTLLLFACVDL